MRSEMQVQANPCNSSSTGFKSRRSRHTDIGAKSALWLLAPIRVRIERDGRRKVYLDSARIGIEATALN